MKTFINQRSIIFLATLFMAFSVEAASCHQTDNSIQDLKEFALKIGEDLKDKTPEELNISQADASVELLDHKFHKIDRSNPGFKQFDSVGIITPEPFENKLQAYGSGVLISPCHVLVNRHLVTRGAKSENEKGTVTLGSQFYFSVGQQQSCKSKDTFQEQNIPSTVVDFGENLDWAVLKLDKKSQVTPPKITDNPHGWVGRAVRAGFPAHQVKDEDGFKFLRAQYVKSVGFGVDADGKSTGETYVSDQGLNHGLSGGGIFTLTSKDRMKLEASLVGIHVGKRTLDFVAIIRNMHQNKRGTAEAIKRARATGACE